MTDDPHFPEYRADSARSMFTSPSAAIGGVGMALGLMWMVNTGASLWFVLGVLAVLIVLFALMSVAFRRSATITGPGHVLARGPFGAKRTAWSDIQAIEIEYEPGGMLSVAVLYDRGGRRIVLPHLNSNSAFSLQHEVAVLRELWERLRGADWAPAPETDAAKTRTRRRNDRLVSVMIAMAAAMVSVLVTAVALLALLFAGVTDEADGPLAVVVSPVMILIVPVVVAIAVFAFSLRRRGR